MRTLFMTLLLLTNLAHADKRFAPVELNVDVATLPPNEQRALGKLVDAAKLMDSIYLRQVWAGNEPMLLDLVQTRSPHLHELIVNKGPWSRLDKNAPFVPGAPPKPPQASFYPADATKAEVEAWINKLPAAQKQLAQGF